jgi:hypothetical protein
VQMALVALCGHCGCWRLTSPARDLCTGLLGWHQQLPPSVLRDVGMADVADMYSPLARGVPAANVKWTCRWHVWQQCKSSHFKNGSAVVALAGSMGTTHVCGSCVVEGFSCLCGWSCLRRWLHSEQRIAQVHSLTHWAACWYGSSLLLYGWGWYHGTSGDVYHCNYW